MKTKNIFLIVIAAIIMAALAAFIGFMVSSYWSNNWNDKDNQTQHQCSPTSSDSCQKMYRPVCGWFDPLKIQCIKYPCAETFSNDCFACADENVDYWTNGECPA